MSSFAVVDDARRKFSQIKDGMVIPINPPSIPGLGTIGGFEFYIQNKGTSDPKAMEEAVKKSYQKALDRKKMAEAGGSFPWTPGNLSRQEMLDLLGYRPLEGAVMASDGFLPFRDSIDAAAEEGIRAVIQPGGSRRDFEIIQAVNEHNMAMVYTLERCFGH